MGMFDKFPYRNTRDLNLNWIIKKIRELEELLGGVVSNFAQFLSKKGGKMEGSIDMQGNRITNVPDPAADADSVNKRYVDRKTGNYLPLKGGKMIGEVDMDYKRIYHLPQPSYGSDVATKKYVDDMDSKYLSFSGGTMSGPVDMGNQKITNVPDPTENQDVATKKYVDEHGGGVTGDYLPLSGGTMTGPVDMGNQKITNVPDPTAEQDVATKKYVDEHGGVETSITYEDAVIYGTQAHFTQCDFRLFLPFTCTESTATIYNLSLSDLWLIKSDSTRENLEITSSSTTIIGGNILRILITHPATSSPSNLTARVKLSAGLTVRKI